MRREEEEGTAGVPLGATSVKFARLGGGGKVGEGKEDYTYPSSPFLCDPPPPCMPVITIMLYTLLLLLLQLL